MVCDCLTGLRTTATDKTAEDVYFNPPREVPNWATVRVLQEMPPTSPFEEVELVSNTEVRGFIRRKYLRPAKPKRHVKCHFHWQNDTAATWTRSAMPAWETAARTQHGPGKSLTPTPSDIPHGKLVSWAVLLELPETGDIGDIAEIVNFGPSVHFGRSVFFTTVVDDDQLFVELRWEVHIEYGICTLSLWSCCGGVAVFFNCVASQPVALGKEPVLTGAFRCNAFHLPYPDILPLPYASETYCLTGKQVCVPLPSHEWVTAEATLALGSVDKTGCPLLHLQSDRQASIIISHGLENNCFGITSSSTVHRTSKFVEDNKAFCFLLCSPGDDGTESENFFAVDDEVSVELDR